MTMIRRIAQQPSVSRTLSYARKQSRQRPFLAASLPLVTVGVLHFGSMPTTGSRHHPLTPRVMTEARRPSSDGSDDKGNKNELSFDISEHWGNAKEYLEKTILTKSQSEDSTSPTDEKSGGQSILGFFSSLASSKVNASSSGTTKEADEQQQNLKDVQSKLMGLLTGRTAGQQTVDELIAKARTSSEQGEISDSVSLEEVLNILKTVGTEFDQTFTKYLEGRDLPPIYPTNLYYFLEYEDERKNFSWRRRKHRFCPGINMESITELNGYMRLAEIGYEDEIDKIREELRDTFGYELVYCQMDSLPGQPSHFVAVKKDQSQWSSSLDMMLCVRGTATITDVITDLLADAVEYRGGKARSGICQSGKFLAEKHQETFQKFLDASGKKKINLTLIGHSLGAGAASIAGMELNARPEFDVKVIGFGCPALLSKELSESTEDYITTVVSDNDCIPRMSLVTMINTILDIGEYNWIPRAQQDLEDVVSQVQLALPDFIKDSTKDSLLQLIDKTVLASVDIAEATTERLDPVLFPPGKCIHLYRDGYGLSGAVVPCTFFDSLDVNRRMVDDHLFDTGYRLVFLDLMRQYKGDHYFQFDIKK